MDSKELRKRLPYLLQQASEERLLRHEWIQRDLEDQINEELSNHKKQRNMSTRQRVASTISSIEILDLLKNGYTRYTKDDIGFGSIQEKFGMTAAAVKRMFMNPSIKSMRTRVPDPILKDREEVIIEVAETLTESPLFS